MFDPKEFEINEQRYRLTYTALNLLLKISPLNINVHDLQDKGRRGSIFLFNHFTRFETFIPQYILYDTEKVFCRSVADYKLFEDELLGDYLRSVGAIPNNLSHIMNYMVDEINLGRKLVIFPEGGMVKDRKVRDREGRLAIYKREGGFRRKPHTGAAVMAILCRMLRDLYLMAREKGDTLMTDYYRRRFPAFDNLDELDSFAGEAVEIVPANITFYPMRRDENILERYVRRFSGVTSKRILEEMKVEGNILFKQTDMDVRFGEPVKVVDYLDSGYRIILKSRYFLDRAAAGGGGKLRRKAFEVATKRFDVLAAGWTKKRAGQMRDAYMNAIYDLTTINLGHLLAHTLFDLREKEPGAEFGISYLRSLLYMAIADMRNLKGVCMHKDINTREYVDSLLLGEEPRLLKILKQFEKAGLLELREGRAVVLKDKLEEDFPFDSIRIENPAQVLDNEAQSVPKAVESLDRLYKEEGQLVDEKVSLLLFRRALKEFENDEKRFRAPEYDEVNKNDQRTTSGAPFFYRTGKAREETKGVLLIHGFSSSPAEMKVIGDYLYERGYDVFGVRLPGHGTSPADLKERGREEWLREVKLGISLLNHHCPEVFIVGNSMGALLGIMAMGTSSFDIAGFVAIAPAFRIKDRRLPFVTYVDAAQRLYQLFADLKTEWPYIRSRAEHPEINYSTLPYHGLYELYQVTKEAQEFVEKLEVPTLFIQAEREYTVDPEATYEAFERVPAIDKTLLRIDDERHVLTLDEELPLFKAISDFLERK